MWIVTAAYPGTIEKIDLATGNVLAGPTQTLLPPDPQLPPGFGYTPEAILVVGDRRVAQIAPADIPTLSPLTALALLGALALIGYRLTALTPPS